MVPLLLLSVAVVAIAFDRARFWRELGSAGSRRWQRLEQDLLAGALPPLASLREMVDEARGCAYAVYFSLAMAWGCFYEVFTFFLEDVGRMSPDRAAAVRRSHRGELWRASVRGPESSRGSGGPHAARRWRRAAQGTLAAEARPHGSTSNRQ